MVTFSRSLMSFLRHIKRFIWNMILSNEFSANSVNRTYHAGLIPDASEKSDLLDFYDIEEGCFNTMPNSSDKKNAGAKAFSQAEHDFSGSESSDGSVVGYVILDYHNGSDSSRWRQ